MSKKDIEILKEKVSQLLKSLKIDLPKEVTSNTPFRVANALRFLTDGYKTKPEDIFRGAVYKEECDEMIVVKDIEVFSLCEHHLLPFFGRCHIAYIPDKQIIGLSKLARLVDVYAKRLQVQERLTLEIAKSINKHLRPKGVAVVIEAQHLCMMMRGVQKQNSKAITSAMFGVFKKKQRTRMEFLELIR